MVDMWLNFNGASFKILNPRSGSRKIIFQPDVTTSQAFGLPEFSYQSVKVGSFIGDVKKGGSCNVRILSFSPHNLTHIETAAHITNNGTTITDVPHDHFSGIGYLLDLSKQDLDEKLIRPSQIKEIKSKINSEISFILIKTNSSIKSEHFNFTGTDPIALKPETTRYIRKEFPQIVGLFLDLPSADREKDEGKLLAHRNFFDLSPHVIEGRGNNNFIVELAYFKEFEEGYYYVTIAPTKVELDAIISDISIFDLKRIEE